MSTTITLAAALLIFVTGCSGEGGLATRGQSITHGSAATGADEVVGVLVDGALVCTGTLVSPTVVLTAGHCVAVEPDAVFLGDSLAAARQVVDVTDSAVADGYQWPELDQDIGLLALAAPAEAVPIELPRGPIPDLAGSDIRIIGFGATDGDGSGMGEKREGTTRIAEVDPETFTSHPDPSQTCSGDSGGPALRGSDGHEVVVGVTSAGDLFCDQFAISTRVDRHVDSLILPFVETHDDDGVGCRVGSRGSPPPIALLLAAGLLAVRRGGAAGPSRRRPRSR